MSARPANRLAAETSPYLRQHAHNPVDWYPWGPEAFGVARRENRAILLSVGYSACHWCHVMEHESFEDEVTAWLMNVVVADGGARAAANLLEPLSRIYLPNRITLCYDPQSPPAVIPPFARDKPTVGSRPTAYVCHRFTCSAPVTEWSALHTEIEGRP